MGICKYSSDFDLIINSSCNHDFVIINFDNKPRSDKNIHFIIRFFMYLRKEFFLLHDMMRDFTKSIGILNQVFIYMHNAVAAKPQPRTTMPLLKNKFYV